MASGDISLSTPVSKSVCPNVSASPKEEEIFYLAIPQSHMNRAEVKSLLAEGEAKKDLSPVKSEPTCSSSRTGGNSEELNHIHHWSYFGSICSPRGARTS